MATKVSQATIDKIKKMGMTAALKSAPKANAEMTEALRRMYGQKRLDAASKASKPGRAVMTQRSSSSGSTTKSNAPGSISGKTQVKMPGAGPTVKIAQAKKANGLPGVTRGGSSSTKFPINFDKIQAKIGANSPADVAALRRKANAPKVDKRAAVVATMANRMGISVAEYNRRAAAAEAKFKKK